MVEGSLAVADGSGEGGPPARARVVAPPGWSRWLVPPAALSVHLAIGQVYAWSVFKPPLESSMDLSGTASALPFQLGIVMLGLSAAFGGTLVERRGPRWAMLVSLVCFSAGFLVASAGAALEQYWLVVFGYGVVGGTGLGIGYISPVSTLIKWFPDRPGLATGTAIMGFGGGALIASPWSTRMLDSFGRDTGGIATTFLVHGLVYAVFMTLGALLVRVPPPGWRPAGWRPEDAAARPLVTTANVSARNAVRTPQFWCLWVVLCMNVTAGIGILEKAAPMITDFFADTDTPVTGAAAAGFVALLSLANMTGRILWSSTSDLVGRKNMYRVYLGAGALMYLAIARLGDDSKPLFVGCAMVILSFYGGGFATVPAYLRDLFGTYQVGAIHGRLLTAWSTAGVLGPLIVNRIADEREEAGHSGPGLYSVSLTIMIALLVVGIVANELVRPVHPRFHEPVERDAGGAPAAEAARTARGTEAAEAAGAAPTAWPPRRIALAVFAWAWVTLPFLYGLTELLRKAAKLF
ncbi:OFA family MFS transporter [Streptomyces capparidis]